MILLRTVAIATALATFGLTGCAQMPVGHDTQLPDATSTGNISMPMGGSDAQMARMDEQMTFWETAPEGSASGNLRAWAALAGASVALLTIYDMAKALDKAMVIGGVRLLSKSGGKSGDWQAPDIASK